MIDTRNINKDLSPGIIKIINWFNDNGFDGYIKTYNVNKTEFVVSKNGVTETLEVPAHREQEDSINYVINSFENNFNLHCEVISLRQELEKQKGKNDFDIEALKNSFFENFEPEEYLDESCLDTIEILCAKHTLWIYDDADGEQAEFNGRTFHNVDFRNKNLCGAILSHASFKNCNFDNASLCSCEIQNSIFENCKFTNIVAEESDFSNSIFLDCDFRKSIMTHSNYCNAKMYNCDFENAFAPVSFVYGIETIDCIDSEFCFDECTIDPSEYDSTLEIGGM